METRVRDTSSIAQCVKCNTQIAKIKVMNTFKLGFHICDRCFHKLDAYDKVKPTEIIEL